MEQTFGSYVREKRMARGLSLRGLAAKLEVSPVYMSNMENDRRPAPTKEKMDRLIEILGLCQADTELLLDLAAKSKTQRVSADLPEYIMERDIVRAALRTAKEVDATDEEWQEFIDRITLQLNQPIFADACNYGHFTRANLPWEQTGQAGKFAELCAQLDHGDGGG